MAGSYTDHLFTHLTYHLVYYRLYSREEAIPSKHRIFSNDDYIGRINAVLVPPPHTAESIKRCIARHEDIVDYGCVALFEALSSKTPISNEDHVPILVGAGSGSTLQEPMALVVADASELANANNSIKDRTYVIRNPDQDVVWHAHRNPIQHILFYSITVDAARSVSVCQVSLSS
jgi:hypothetical protein